MRQKDFLLLLTESSSLLLADERFFEYNPLALLGLGVYQDGLDLLVFRSPELSSGAVESLRSAIRSGNLESGLESMMETMQAIIDANLPKNETIITVTKIQKSNTKRIQFNIWC